MNAGIADAMNLSRMLASVIKAGRTPLLEAYEIERRPPCREVRASDVSKRDICPVIARIDRQAL
jgi:2-polyprenyl-6-methoxyphenol hydroxylase-like FAD-dependent oxidoreductase